MRHPDQCTKGWFAADKGFGAINRIDNPFISSASGTIIAGQCCAKTEFLAYNNILGKLRGDRLT